MTTASGNRSRRALLALLVLVVAVLAVLVLRSRNEGRHPAPAVEAPRAPRTDADERAPAELAALEPASTRSVVAPDESPRAASTRIKATSRPRGRLPTKQGPSAPSVPTDPGVLEVIVLDGDTPLRAVAVAIRAPDESALPERAEDVADPARVAFTDALGLVRFAGLAPAAYEVGAWIAPRIVVTSGTDVSEGAGRRLFLRVGSGVVHGRVHGSDRTPLGDAQLVLRTTPDAAHNVTIETRSDAGGRFRFERVPAGFCLLLQERYWEPSAARARFYLAAGETIEIQLGHATAPTEWTGALRASSGESLAVLHDVQIDEANHGNEYTLRTDERGRFRFELPPGEYIVGPEDAWGVAGFLHVDVGARQLERDLVATGVVLRARIAPADLARATTLRLVAAEGSGYPLELGRNTGAAQGALRYWIVGAPRSCRLVADGPNVIRGAPAAGLDVDLAGRDGLVTIDVELVPR